MRKIKYNDLIIVILLLFAGISCSQENIPTDKGKPYEGERVLLGVKMDSKETNVDDAEIKTIRVIVFTNGNEMVYNEVRNVTPSGNTYNITVQVARGANDIHFICNETTEMATKLAAVTTQQEIANMSYATSAVKDYIPMYSKVGSAIISADIDGTNVQVEVGGVKYSVLTTKVSRLMAKLSFNVIKNITGSTPNFAIEEVRYKVCRMPKHSYLGDGKPYNPNEGWADQKEVVASGTIPLTGGDGEYEYDAATKDYKVPSGVSSITAPDIYIPEYILQNNAKSDYSTYLLIEAKCRKEGSSSYILSKYVLDLAHSYPTNYNILRNNNYKIYATITDIGAMGLYAEIVAEDYDITINWTPLDGLILVSDKASDYGRNVNVWNDYTTYSAILKIVNAGVYKDALFKYGSIIAIAGTEGSASFTPATDVLWRPEIFTTTIASWGDIPYRASGDIPSPNNSTDVAAGLGDPCRLVGLTPQQIRTGVVDNGSWRMATDSEYQYLITASVGTDARGYGSYQYLLQPNVPYRDENGDRHVDVVTGSYWSSIANKVFSFNNSSNGTISNGTTAYSRSIRCVRKSIPTSTVSIANESLKYTGGEAAIVVIDNNLVPYWKVTLKSGDASGFSFKNNKYEGNFSGNVVIVANPLPDKYIARDFIFNITGYGLDGITHTKDITINQPRHRHSFRMKSISPTPTEIDGNLWFSKEAIECQVWAEIPEDYDAAAYPDAEWYISVFVTSGSVRSVVGTTVKYGEPSVVTIPANDDIGVRTIYFKPIAKDLSKYPPTIISEATNNEILQKYE